MSKLDRCWKLQWSMELLERGYTCFTLYDEQGRRWGWIINAGVKWMAHVGDFGRCATEGHEPVPVMDKADAIVDLCRAKSWVEESIAAVWSGLTEVEES